MRIALASSLDGPTVQQTCSVRLFLMQVVPVPGVLLVGIACLVFGRFQVTVELRRHLPTKREVQYVF